MTGHVTCLTCNRRLYSTASQDPTWFAKTLTTQLIAAHACEDHRACTLTFEVEEWAGLPPKDLHIRCLHVTCRNKPVYEASCPIQLVDTHTLAFHTSHEGHPIEVTWGGEVIARSPTR